MVYNSHLVTWHVACVGLPLVQHRVDFANSNFANYLLQRTARNHAMVANFLELNTFLKDCHLQCPTREEKCRLPFISWEQSYTGKSCLSSFSFFNAIFARPWFVEIQKFCYHGNATQWLHLSILKTLPFIFLKNKTFEIPVYDCVDRLLSTQHLS